MVTVKRPLAILFDSLYFASRIGFLNSVVIRLICKVGHWNISLPFAAHKIFLGLCDSLTCINLRDTRLKAEPEIVQYFQVENGKSFVDIGANIGFYTRMMALRGVCVYAFEPSPKTYKVLQASVKYLWNVQAFNFALGDENIDAKTLYLHPENSPINGFILSPDNERFERITVKVRMLDNFKLTNVGLIKIDTEGYEYPILKGALETLRREKPRMIIEMHEPLWRNDTLIASLLQQLGYKDLQRRWLSSYDKFFVVVQ